MTTPKITTRAPGMMQRPLPKPPLPDPPKQPDMNQNIHFERAGVSNTLFRHFAHHPDVLVAGEGYVCYNRSQIRSGWRVPDLVVTFGVEPDAITDNNGYEIDDVGKPPDFVMEVASRHTARNDYTRKRDDYAAFGAGESWRYDYTGGRYYDAPLAGDRLVNGRYERIPLHSDHPGKMFGMLSGYSDALDLYLCWDEGDLRFYDPKTGEFLMNPSELEAELSTAQSERDAAQLETRRRRRTDPRA